MADWARRRKRLENKMRSSVLGQKRPTHPPVRIRPRKDGSIDRLLPTSSTGTTRRAFPNSSTGSLSDSPLPPSPADQNKLGRVHPVSSSEALPGKSAISHQGPSLPELRVVLPDKCHPYPRHHSQQPDPRHELQCEKEEPIKTVEGRMGIMVDFASAPEIDSEAELENFFRWQKELKRRRYPKNTRTADEAESLDREAEKPLKRRQNSNGKKAGTELENVSNKLHQERMGIVAGKEEKAARFLRFKDVSGREFTFPFQYCCTWTVRTSTITLSIVWILTVATLFFRAWNG